MGHTTHRNKNCSFTCKYAISWWSTRYLSKDVHLRWCYQSGKKQRSTKELDREQDVNASKFRKNTVILPSDKVMMWNHKKKSKVDPEFFPDLFTVLDTSNEVCNLLIQQDYDGSVYRRHPDDINPFDFTKNYSPVPSNSSEKDAVQKFYQCLVETSQNNTDGDGNFDLATDIPHLQHQHVSFEPRRSTRTRRQNQRYFNEDFTHWGRTLYYYNPGCYWEGDIWTIWKGEWYTLIWTWTLLFITLYFID